MDDTPATARGSTTNRVRPVGSSARPHGLAPWPSFSVCRCRGFSGLLRSNADTDPLPAFAVKR
jgi:hypothetical protein